MTHKKKIVWEIGNVNIHTTIKRIAFELTCSLRNRSVGIKRENTINLVFVFSLKNFYIVFTGISPRNKPIKNNIMD